MRFPDSGLNEKSEAANVAVTDSAAARVSVQSAEPEQAPLQPENVELEAGAGVSVTAIPPTNVAEH